MNKLFTPLLLVLFSFAVNAQTTQSYGKIDQADLELKACDFEKDANAEILFDKAEVAPEGTGYRSALVMKRHIRIKIFNDFGKSLANVRIVYFSFLEGVVVNDLQAQTVNLNNGKVEVSPMDKKSVYIEKIDKLFSAMVFSFPNVKAGSVLEYKYSISSQSFPTWYFQNYVPTRYSEIEVSIPSFVNFKSIPHVKQPFLKSVGDGADAFQVRAIANIHSMPDEPYMGSRNDNLQRIEYTGVNTDISTWAKIGERLMKYNDFGYDLTRSLTGESTIINKAKSLGSEDEKIAYIFDAVKNGMKWDKTTRFYTIDGTGKAWDKKAGNSAEINMILYHLLKKSGIKAYPLVVSTKGNGKVNPANPNMYSFNNTVVSIQIDSTKRYVLDASDKYNLYNTIPANILNTFGLLMDPNSLSIDEYGKSTAYNMDFISNDLPAMQSVSLTAEIKPGGKLEGNAEITSYGYNKTNALQFYEDKGEQKYLDTIRNNDNSLKISDFKRENMDVDSLPLSQKFNLNADLTGSDENYIYFNTTILNSMGKNPFISEERFSDIDFGYRDNCSIYSVYKIPAGYKADALPKTVTIVMPDQSIIFKRTVVEDNGTLLVKCVLNHRKTIYFREDYQDLHGFYKKMYELLNEQIVLKKS